MLEASYAKRTIFGERIAHGMLVLAIGSALLLRLGESALLPRSSLAVYEVEKVRFRAATRIGDTLYLESEVRGMKVLDTSRGLLAIYNVIKNQRREIVVSFTAKVLVGRRPNHETHQPVGSKDAGSYPRCKGHRAVQSWVAVVRETDDSSRPDAGC